MIAEIGRCSISVPIRRKSMVRLRSYASSMMIARTAQQPVGGSR
jgi:hypothetical protein